MEYLEVRCQKYNKNSHRTCNKLLFKVVDGKIEIKCSCGEIVKVDIQDLLETK